jgi:signal transduction histidine kinase
MNNQRPNEIFSFFYKITDWFIPLELDDANVGPDFMIRARMTVSIALFGAIFSIIIILINPNYPDYYRYLLFLLLITAIASLFAIKTFKVRVRVIGKFTSLIFAITLIVFNYKSGIFFTQTSNWYLAPILLACFLVGKRWGLFLTTILLLSIIHSHHFYFAHELSLSHSWSIQNFANNTFSDKFFSLIFGFIIIYYFLIAREKTEQKIISTQKLLLKQQETIFKSSRMAELGEVAGGIAHEINNPLTIITGNSQKIEKLLNHYNENDIEKLREMTGKIISTCNRISKIIIGLRNYSRDGAQDPMEPILLEKLFNDVGEIFREKLYHASIAFKIENPNSQSSIIGRYTQIYQILVNLINNSIDAIQDNENKEIGIEVKEFNGMLEISVFDNGPGISPEIEEKVFQPFFTTKPLGKGTGLGLSIAGSIVEEHKGNLCVDRRYNDSRITMRFPL